MIRPKTVQDLPRLTECIQMMHKDHQYPVLLPPNPTNFIDPPNQLGAWVAEDQGEVVGLVMLRPIKIPPPNWWPYAKAQDIQSPDDLAMLGRLFVLPNAQRKGLALQLLRVAQTEAQALGKRAVLEVHHQAKPAIALYQKEGWQKLVTLTASWHEADGHHPQIHIFLAPYPSIC